MPQLQSAKGHSVDIADETLATETLPQPQSSPQPHLEPLSPHEQSAHFAQLKVVFGSVGDAGADIVVVGR